MRHWVVGETAQGATQPVVVEVGGREFADEPPGVGEVGRRRCPGQPDVLEARTVGVGALGGVQQHLDAGEPLRDGVVDLPGQSGALGEHARLVLGGGELVAGGDQLGMRFSRSRRLTGQGLVAEPDQQGDAGPDSGPTTPPRLQPLCKPRRADGHDGGPARPRPARGGVPSRCR